MKPLNLVRTAAALKEFEATAATRDGAWDAAMDAEDPNVALGACVREDARAWYQVKVAFFEDTFERNTWRAAMYVTPEFVRRLLAKYPPTL